MEKAAKEQRYEEAASLRDKMIAIENISQKQKVTNFSNNDIDVIRTCKKRALSLRRSIFRSRKQDDRKRALFLK